MATIIEVRRAAVVALRESKFWNQFEFKLSEIRKQYGNMPVDHIDQLIAPRYKIGNDVIESMISLIKIEQELGLVPMIAAKKVARIMGIDL